MSITRLIKKRKRRQHTIEFAPDSVLTLHKYSGIILAFLFPWTSCSDWKWKGQIVLLFSRDFQSNTEEKNIYIFKVGADIQL